MIKTKTKGRKGRDDVSFDLDDEEGKEENEEVKKERVQEKRRERRGGHTEREKRTRPMRETIVYEARGV